MSYRNTWSLGGWEYLLTGELGGPGGRRKGGFAERAGDNHRLGQALASFGLGKVFESHIPELKKASKQLDELLQHIIADSKSSEPRSGEQPIRCIVDSTPIQPCLVRSAAGLAEVKKAALGWGETCRDVSRVTSRLREESDQARISGCRLLPATRSRRMETRIGTTAHFLWHRKEALQGCIWGSSRKQLTCCHACSRICEDLVKHVEGACKNGLI